MTAASEKISEQALRDCIVTHPRSSFERIHNAAIDELLQLRAEHEKAELLINDLRRMDLEGGKGSECHEVLRRAIAYLTAQGAARGKG